MQNKFYFETKRNRRVAFFNAVRLNLVYFTLGLSFTVVALVKLGCLPADFLGFTISPF